MKCKFARTSLVIVLALVMALTACNTWPTIIATAQAMSSVTTIFYPAVGTLSALAVSLLQQAEAAYQAYQTNKNDGTEAAYIAAIESIETQLPADLQALKITTADQVKVTAVVNIILDFVEAEAAQLPATQTIVANARAKRGAPTVKRMSRSDIKSRWKTEVCKGDSHCIGLLK